MKYFADTITSNQHLSKQMTTEEAKKLSDETKIKYLSAFHGANGQKYDYLNSLDVLHILEEKLTRKQKTEYFSSLCFLMATRPTDEPAYLYHIKPEVKVIAMLAVIVPNEIR